MARLNHDTIKAALRHLEKSKIFTIGQLSSALKCSVPSTRLKLKQWRTFTSYNQNGRYYTLPQVPRFDHYGLWHHKNVSFSKHGNLGKTLAHLVASATGGLSGKQLGERLGLSPQSFLHHFRNCPGICREKHDGVFVYFSDKISVYEKQVRNRRSLIVRQAFVRVSDSEAIMILVAVIRHHGISVEEILALPEMKKNKMKLPAIQSFFEDHGLGKKNSGFTALKLIKVMVDRLISCVSAPVLFPKPPNVYFYPEINECPACGSTLHVQKSRTKTVVTMDIGTFRANEIVLFCPRDQTVFSSQQLRSLVPVHGTFGFDIVVEVGLALFVHCRNNRETMAELAAKNVFVSERQISYLGRKFIIYLALAHRQSQLRLRSLMARKGGYILHVDGTCEGDSPNFFCGLDGISEIVLDTIKIPSEKKEQLVPFFQRIKDQYGEPKALVHDMSRAIISAVEEVFPAVADFICHFHFLRDIGKDLLSDDYTALRKRLQKLKVRSLLRQRAKYIEKKIDPVSHQTIDEIVASLETGAWQATSVEHIPLITTYALIHWVFEYPSQSNGYGFPFDRPHLDFYRRLQKVHQLLGKIMDVHLRGHVKDNKPFLLLDKTLKKVVEDKRLHDLATNIERKMQVFDKLRTAMRIALPESKNGINDNGDNIDMRSIEEKVTEFKQWVDSDGRKKTTYAKMLEQLDKYWDKLFTKPIAVDTPEGILYIQPQRTNNILEQFFRGEKRRDRKKNGVASLNKVLKASLAETPLVQNLKNCEYMDIILNGCTSLEERFSQIDVNLVQKEMENINNSSGKILPAVKKLIKNSDLTVKIASLFTATAK